MNISLNIDKSGEKQNVVIDTDSTEYLMEQIDWLPMADLEADETGNGEYQSGYLNVRASGAKVYEECGRCETRDENWQEESIQKNYHPGNGRI